MAYIGKQPVVGNFVKLDAITTSATATYNLLNGGVAYFPQTANNCIVSLNGVIQSPTSAYTISGSTIVFDSALTSSDTIDFILVLGDVLNIGTPSDSTVGFAKVTSNLITGATAETSIDGADSVLIYDDSASALRKMTRTNFVSGLSVANTPAFQAAFQGGDQTISNNTNTKVVFSTENFDTDSRYDPTTNYRFTPVTTGKYFVYADILPQTGNYSFDIMIYKNGAESFKQRIGGVTVDPVSIGVHGIVDITLSTDYIEVYAWQNSGGNKIIYGSSAFGRFGAYKLIGV
jgi:hypothetical protein